MTVHPFLDAVKNLPDSYRDNLFDMGMLQPLCLDYLAEKIKTPDAFSGIQVIYEPPFLNRIFLSVPKDDKKNNDRVFVSLHYFFNPDGSLEPGMQDVIKNPYRERKVAFSEDHFTPLYHPHPWSASFRLLQGHYKQRVGKSERLGLDHPPQQTEWSFHNADHSENCAYVFGDPLLWHEVWPANGSVSTLMISYRPQDWAQDGPKPPTQQPCLDRHEIALMCAHFQPLINRARQ
jgi:hypothetical protein